MKNYFRIISSETFDKRTGAEYICVEVPKVYFNGVKEVPMIKNFGNSPILDLATFLKCSQTTLAVVVKSEYKDDAFDGIRTFVQRACALKVYSERIEGLLTPEAMFQVSGIKDSIELQIIKLATEYAKNFLLRRVPQNPVIFLEDGKGIELGPGEQFKANYETEDKQIQITLELFSLPNGMIRVHETEICDIEENYCSQNESWRICSEQDVFTLLQEKAEGYVGYPVHVSYEHFAQEKSVYIIKDILQIGHNKLKHYKQEERV